MTVRLEIEIGILSCERARWAKILDLIGIGLIDKAKLGRRQAFIGVTASSLRQSLYICSSII